MLHQYMKGIQEPDPQEQLRQSIDILSFVIKIKLEFIIKELYFGVSE